MNVNHLFHHAALAPALGVTLLALAGCAAGPDYRRPAFSPPAAYKEAGPWTPARPKNADANQPWWTGYGDADLDALVAQANAASQDIRVAEAPASRNTAPARPPTWRWSHRRRCCCPTSAARCNCSGANWSPARRW